MSTYMVSFGIQSVSCHSSSEFFFTYEGFYGIMPILFRQYCLNSLENFLSKNKKTSESPIIRSHARSYPSPRKMILVVVSCEMLNISLIGVRSTPILL